MSLLLLFGGFAPYFVTDTNYVNLPVDYYMPELPQYDDAYRTVEGSAGIKSVSIVARQGGSLLHKKSSFTVKTGKRGYD